MKAARDAAAKHSSNRTFMELKLLWTSADISLKARSNRTFMELKLNRHQKN